MTLLQPVAARFLRAAFAVILAGLVAKYGHEPAYAYVVAPALMAFGKWLRDKYGLDWVPV